MLSDITSPLNDAKTRISSMLYDSFIDPDDVRAVEELIDAALIHAEQTKISIEDTIDEITSHIS